MLVMAVILVFGLLGLWLLVTGLRPRAVDDHPVCAACEYDLVGMAAAVPEKCPECGQDLRDAAGSHAGIRIGNRTRRARRAWWGAAVLGVWLMVVVPVGVSVLGGAPLAKVEPTWLLILQAEHAFGRAADAAVDELMSRGKVMGAVPAAVQLRLAKRALAVQRLTSPDGRASAGWSKSWQGVLEDPATFGLLSAAEQGEALAAGVHGWMVARKVVVQGRGLPLAVRVNFDPRFLGPTGRAASVKTVQVRVLDANGNEVAAKTQHMAFQGTAFATAGQDSWTGSERLIPLDIPPGAYTLEADCQVQLVGAAPPGVAAPVPIHHAQKLEVIAPSAAPPGVVDAPELLEQLRTQLHIVLTRSAYNPSKTWVSMAWGDPGQAMQALGDELERRGLACVYKVRMRPQTGDGPEVEIGRFVLCRRAGGWGVMPGGEALDNPVLGGAHILRLTPDSEFAEGSVEYERILGGEIELQNVNLPSQ